jgi:hypothetical protein
VGVLDFLVPIFPFVVFVIALSWPLGILVLFFRFRTQQRAYLRRFPPVEPHVTLDRYTFLNGLLYGARRGTWRRIDEAMSTRQDDPDLEALRRDTRRRYSLFLLWIYGFPALAIGGAALLRVAGGLVRLH